ncbi:serine hydrolase domain-containing protein [Paenibacillus sp. chi10]|uniref:Serine hydrolase domain-containing protein n=1 Tax=Paenibacillus suaedae TaxID=3077233 RepID=A0AAJ2K529_9BACL|nr:serine hydrolase domain-containing protein [Paenibacillus sp. chi10]MDT8979868.1 serine hydrolase domain-containing protein [Paenibacillus sp. chi10]
MRNKTFFWVPALTLALSMIVPSSAMASTSGGNVASAAPGLEQIAAEKAALLTKMGTVSVQYALIDNGKITVSGQAGINDREGKKPLTKDTMYGIGSTSKVFTAAAVMKLADEGKIDLDAPLIDYIPDFTMKDERYKQITPRMLLNHSSGLQGTSMGNAFLFEDNDTYSHDTLLKQLSTQSLKANPGAFSVYCNDGFTLAEILVERVSGMSFTAFIHNNFTEPLKLSHTKTSQDVLEQDKLAGLYFPFYPGQLPNETVNMIGTGGIYSTAEDLVRFSQLFTGETKGILSDKAVQAMANEEYRKGLWPEDTDNSFNYGLGWDSVKLFPFNEYGMKGLAKGGDTMLYHASLVVLPEQKMAAAVLTSGGSSMTNEMLANDLLLQALKEKGAIKTIKPEKSFGKPVKAGMPAEVANQAGYYGTRNQQVKVEIKKDGELTLPLMTLIDHSKEKYVYTSDGSFINENGTSKVSFVTEKNGRTYIWVREYMTMPGLGQFVLSHYAAEKLEENKLSKETAETWEKRKGITFYQVNEKYTSILYFLMKPTIQIALTDELPGYLGDKKITGSNTAESELNIPGMLGGRDLAESRFFSQDGVEYMEEAGKLYISGANVNPLYAGKSSTATLQANGHARWYTVPDAAAGKTMTVALPAKGGFVVYNEQGLPVNFTVVSGKNEVTLPKNGTIVFAGTPGSEFGITLK